MDPRCLGATDAVLHDVDEGGHVVIGDRLAFEHRLDERGVDARRTRRGRPAASASGTTPIAACASVASSSTSSQRSNRATSDQTAVISGVE